jgi:hypothetical protein
MSSNEKPTNTKSYIVLALASFALAVIFGNMTLNQTGPFILWGCFAAFTMGLSMVMTIVAIFTHFRWDM